MIGSEDSYLSHERAFPWLLCALVLLLALVVRLVQLDHAPHFDEFYHLLAALSVLADGDTCIAECLSSYNRGAPFTYVLAGVLGLAGKSFVAARLLSVTAGLLLVASVFWFTWRVGGRTAAVAAGVLLAISPEAIYISQFTRFYAWHAALVWLGATALFFAVHHEESKPAWYRWGLAAAGAAALFGALSLQITTMIAGVGIAFWLLLDPIAAWARRAARRSPGRLALAVVGVLACVGAALVAAVQTELLGELWANYRATNLHTEAVADDIRFYHRFLLESYPTFYTLLPVAFATVLWKRPAVALFSGAVFGTALVLQSGGGFKATRFLFYAMPFFFALWGVALGVVLPHLARGTRDGVASWLSLDDRSGVARGGAMALLALAAVAVLGTNSAYNTTLKLLTVSDAEWPTSKPPYRGRPEWRPAVPVLRDLVQESDVVVTTSSVKSLFYLGRSDAELSVSRLFTGSGFAPDFAIDPRVGGPVLRSPDAMARLVACYPTGLIVVEGHTWATTWGILPETGAIIAALTEEIDLPPGSDLRAFRWRSGSATADDVCDPPPLSGSEAARAGG